MTSRPGRHPGGRRRGSDRHRGSHRHRGSGRWENGRWDRLTVDLRPLAVPEFRRLWAAGVVAAVGGSFAVMAVPAQLFQLTGSSAVMAASSTVSFVALLVSSLGSGVLADTTDRRRLLLTAHSVLALVLGLFWLRGVLDVRSVPLMLVLVAAQGVALGAVMTTTGAVVPRLVPGELLPAAAALSSLSRGLGSVTGPLLAGALIPLAGLSTLYLLDCAALLTVLWAVFLLPALPAPPLLPAIESAHGSGRVLEGFRYLAAQRVLAAVMGVDLAATAFGLPFSLFPELAVDMFGDPPGGGPALGLLCAAYPVGTLATGPVSGGFTRARRHGVWLTGAAVAWGISLVLLGFAPGLPLALAALVAGGGVNFVLSTFRNAVCQQYTDDALRGRIQGSLTVLLIGGPQLAGVLHGLVSPGIGPRATVAAGGAATVLAVVVIALTVPALWRYRSPHEPLVEHERDGNDDQDQQDSHPAILTALPSPGNQ
ncbi:MFS transporter [Kineosporia sp. J2-2]|uniref:MFS transporter n=1 Tax=Kineosporia corallincola TaxID=2835133 RepID=A0ABS5TQ32_9ACTN|nr:MFS transporter [Kineosporia corallincola]MBT0773220.1 MFS transporter [Kineosporia corallincola]